MQKIFIKNRYGLKMAVRLTVNENNDKLVFLEHGLSSRKEYPHMLVLEEQFANHGYNVINFDATNSLNESECSENGITNLGHYEDLEDVINWAKSQDFYCEPFALAGHSLGALSVVKYAGLYPKCVNLLLACGFPYMNFQEEIDDIKVKEILEHGFYKKISKSTGKTFVMKKDWLDDLKIFDLTPLIKNITAKTFVIIGTKDTEKHIKNSKMLFDLLRCEKQYIELDDVPHDLANSERDKNLFENKLNEILN